MAVRSKVEVTRPTHQRNEKSEVRKVLPQTLAVMVKNVLLISYGMTMGFPTILIPSLSKRSPEEDIFLNQEQISWIGSISMMCVPIGCLLSGVVTQPIGRKRSMQCGSVPIVICWMIFRFCDDVWQIYFALAFTGLSGGLLEAPVLTYVAEITQPHLRGILSATSAFAVILGVLVEFLLGSFLNWRTVAIYSCIAPLLSFILLFFVPESPHWYIMKNRLDDARKSLAWLRGWTTVSEIEEEFQELASIEKRKDLDKENEEKKIPIKIYTKRRFFCPLALVTFVFFLGHFTGMTSLQTYAVLIFSTLQVPIDSYYATILLGIAQFIGSILCVILIRYIGKRGLVFASLSISGSCFLIVATYAYLIDVKYLVNLSDITHTHTEISNNQWIPLIFLEIAALAATGGIRVLPWILIGEVFSRETRAIGSGIAGAIAYIIGFASNKVFLQTVAAITLPGTFWFYGSMAMLGVLILYFWLPETEGKGLQEISDHFARKTRIDNKIRRRRRSSNMQGTVNEAYDTKVPDKTGNHNGESKF